MTDRLITTRDVARMLGISEATVKRRADQRLLPSLRTPGGHRKFLLRDVVLFAAERGIRVGPEPLPDDWAKEVDEIVSALLLGDACRLERVISPIRKVMLLAEVCDELIRPAFAQLRQSIAAGTCDRYHEHLAGNAMLDLWTRLLPTRPATAAPGATALVAPAPGESSDVLARLASLVAADCGLQSRLLGCGLPAEAIDTTASLWGASWILLACESELEEAEVACIAAKVSTGAADGPRRVVWIGDRVPPPPPDRPEAWIAVQDLRQLRSWCAREGTDRDA